MSHPFLSLTPSQHKRLFWIFLALTLLATFVLQIIDGALQTPAAPQGIVSYELAGNAQAVGQIFASWDANAGLHAAFSLGFDYLYMLVYAVTLALAVLWLADGFSGLLRHAGILLAWGMGIAGFADATENYFLWQMLINGPSDAAAVIAHGAALLKFTMILLAFLYLIIALLMGFFRNRQGGTKA
jgi:hypothetical protein